MHPQSAIFFIRHSKLDLPYASHLEMPYEVLDDLATSRLDPTIVQESRKLFYKAAACLPLAKIDSLYFNNSGFQSRRSRDSAVLIQHILHDDYQRAVPLVGNSDLKEVDFSLRAILAKAIFEREGMPAVRTAFYRAEIEGGPVEQIAQIYERIKRIFESLREHHTRNETTLLITHDFFMRVIEVYVRVSQDYKKITVADLEKTALNTYFKGFGVSFDLKTFERV